MSADPNGRRLHLWTALVLLAVFAAGAATGAGLATALRAVPPAPPAHAPRQGRPPAPDGMPPFVSELGLDPGQQVRVRAIVDAHRAELEAAVRETFPRIRAVQEKVETEIRAILTPEQAVRLDAIRSRRPPPPAFGGPGMRHGPGPGPDGLPPPPGADGRGPPPGPPPAPPPGSLPGEPLPPR